MIPPDLPWMANALGSHGYGDAARDPDRSVELRLLRIFSEGPQDANGVIALVARTGTTRLRVDAAFTRLRYLGLIDFRRAGWTVSATGKAALAAHDAPPVAARPGPSMATKQLSLF